MQRDNSKELENQSTIRLMWRYFVPAFIGLMVVTLYNVVDRIFIGQIVGVNALSGLTLVMPIMMIIMAFGTLTGMGTGILVSINMGKKDINKAESILGTGFLAQLIIALLVTAFGFFIKTPLLEWFQPEPDTFQFAEDYLNIILFGVIFQTTGWGMNNVIRSQGYAKTAMYSMFVSAITNILLDALFIIVLDMGVKGAAYATILSQLVLAAWVMYHVCRKNALVRLKISNIKINFSHVKEIFAIGFASFAMHIASSAVSIIQNNQLIIFGGDIAVAAMGVISSIAQIFFMALIGINMAAQPIIGFNYGAELYSRVKSTVKIAIVGATAIAIFGALVGEIFPGTLIKLFNNDNQQLLEIGVRGMRICFIALPVIGFQVIAASYFQSVGNAKIAALVSLLRQVIFMIPLFLILPHFLGLDGIWLSWPISDVLAFICSLLLFLRAWKKMPTDT